MSTKEENVDLRVSPPIDTLPESSGLITVSPSTVKLVADLAIIFKRLRQRIVEECILGSTEGDSNTKNLARYDSMAEFIEKSKALFPSVGEFIEKGASPIDPSALEGIQVYESELVWICYLGKFSTGGFLDDASMELPEYILKVKQIYGSHLLKEASTACNKLQASPELAPLDSRVEELMPSEAFDEGPGSYNDEDDQFSDNVSPQAATEGNDVSLRSGSFVSETSTAENFELRQEGKPQDSGSIASSSKDLDSSNSRADSRPFTVSSASKVANWLQDVPDTVSQSQSSLNSVPQKRVRPLDSENEDEPSRHQPFQT